MGIERLVVDLDGVFVDFVSGALEACESSLRPDDITQYEIQKILGLSTQEFWQKINEYGPGFWGDLEAYPWRSDLDELLSSFDPSYLIATSPSESPWCYYGKAEWISRYLPHKRRDVMIGNRKHELAREGYVLVDDCDANVIKFRMRGGAAIAFPQFWNSKRHVMNYRMDGASRLTYVKACLENLR